MLPAQFVNVVLEEKESSGEELPFNDWSDKESPPNNNNVLENWELKTKLPEALLSECTVEICRTPYEKKEAPKLRFEARVTPIYGPDLKKPKRESGYQDGVKIEEQICVVQDILSEVEAVYSDDSDTQEGNSGPGTPPKKSAGTASTANFRCAHCPNVYSNRGALWQHSVASHSLQKNCECSICGRRFYRNCSLALHLKSHAAEEEGLISCSECGKEMKASALEKHMKTHDGAGGEDGETRSVVNGEAACPACPQRFASLDKLEQHVRASHAPADGSGVSLAIGGSGQLMIVNTPPRPHRCCYCGKAYSQKSVLKKHLVIHTGERLTCALCGIDFTQKSSLLRHVKRMHEGKTNPGAPPAAPSSSSSQRIKIPQGISISMVE